MKKGTISFGLALLSAAVMPFLFLSSSAAEEKLTKIRQVQAPPELLSLSDAEEEELRSKIRQVQGPPEFLSLSDAQVVKTRVSRVLDSLMIFHPGWITRSVTSHDPRGGKANEGYTGPVEGEYKVLFHGKGEGRITRIWMSPGAGDNGLRNYKELQIIVDGHTVYRGKPADFFDGKGTWKSPLVLGRKEGPGAFISYVPFSYSREAKVLFKGDPRYFQITYRQGAGSSSGPGYREIAEFLAEPWVKNAPTTKLKVKVAAGKPAVLAKGPLTVATLSLRCKPGDISKLRIRIGKQAEVPAAFFFGLGIGAAEPLKGLEPFRSAVHYINVARGLMVTRLPIPLQEGEELSLSVENGASVSAAYGLAEADAKPGVRLIAQYRDQAGPETGTDMSFFDNVAPAQFVSLVEEVAGGLLGERTIRTDGMAYPLQLGPGTAAYYDGGRDFKGTYANPFAGQPRFMSGLQGDNAETPRFEHSLYRHHILDPIVSRADMRLGFEAGGSGTRHRTLALAYTFDAFRQVSRSSAEMQGKKALLTCPASFVSRAGSKNAGGRGVLLVRHYDASTGAQEAELRINGRSVGTVFEAYANPERTPAADALWADLRSSDCANGFLGVTAAPPAGANWNESRYDALFLDTDGSEDAPLPLKKGSNIRICDAGLPGGPFYINDHTIVRGSDGRWHLMGIFHAELADPLNEIDFVHARAPAGDPAAWTGEDFKIGKGAAEIALSVDRKAGKSAEGIALSVDRSLGETHLWAPHVVRDGDEYVMAFHAGGPEEDSQMKIARSRDLESWQRSPQKPLFTDISTARDPMLLRAGDLWVMYYTRCEGPDTKVNGVAYRTSTDLENWSEPAMAMTLPRVKPLPNSGYTESPFVFERGGWYYLSVTSYPVEYDATFLYRSRSPFNFGDVSIAKFKSHAPEWVEGGDNPGYGPMFMTHAGWGQGGVWLAPVTGW